MSYNIKSQTKKQDNSGYSFVIIIGFFILTLSVNFVKLVREYALKKKILQENTRDYSTLVEEQDKLKLKIKKNQSQEYIEEQARKLTLSKPNEFVVIMASPSPKAKITPTVTPYIANYKLWLQLFNHQ